MILLANETCSKQDAFSCKHVGRPYAIVGRDMHPSGIQFGLSRGLLQLRGEEVLLSDQLVEAIFAQAQLHLQKGRHPIQGNFLVEITVRAAQDAAATSGTPWVYCP